MFEEKSVLPSESFNVNRKTYINITLNNIVKVFYLSFQTTLIIISSTKISSLKEEEYEWEDSNTIQK